VKNKIAVFAFVLGLLSLNSATAQQIQKDTLSRKERLIADPLTPSKAAFYSAVLPGLGQLYLGKAWKVPLVYASIGASVYYYKYNGDELQRYRGAYKRRLAGYEDDEFIEFHQRYRDIAFIFIVGTYVLNIIEANVSAHLLQFNVNDQLSFQPKFNRDFIRQQTNFGLSVNLKF
jgi:hypothetical protein